MNRISYYFISAILFYTPIQAWNWLDHATFPNPALQPLQNGTTWHSQVSADRDTNLQGMFEGQWQGYHGFISANRETSWAGLGKIWNWNALHTRLSMDIYHSSTDTTGILTGLFFSPQPFLEITSMWNRELRAQNWQWGITGNFKNYLRLGFGWNPQSEITARLALGGRFWKIFGSTEISPSNFSQWNVGIQIPLNDQSDLAMAYQSSHSLTLDYQYQHASRPQIWQMPHWVRFSLRGKWSEMRHDLWIFPGDERNLAELDRQFQHLLLNPNIQGILFDFDGYEGNASASLMLRQWIQRLHTQGKRSVAYLTEIRPAVLLAASATEKIVLQPSSMVHFRGLSLQIHHYAQLSGKLGIHPEILRHGTYKSAVESYLQDTLSTEARANLDSLVQGVWKTLADSIALSRPKMANLETWLAKPPLTPTEAWSSGLVDTILYSDQIPKWLRSNIPDWSWQTLDPASPAFAPPSRIAVVMLEGEIVHGSSGALQVFRNGQVGSQEFEKLAELLRAGHFDAIVLRINSPGGSAQASDILWHAFRSLSQELGIPLVVSVGSIAASGGYYIACAGDVIWTEPTAIVGSIGVFGGKVDLSSLFAKIGITTSIVKSHPSADAEGLHRPLSPAEKDLLQSSMEDFYQRFVSVVSQSRHKTLDQMSLLAEGRVFSGLEAVHHGLADSLGTLQDAIQDALRRSGKSGRTFEIQRIGFGKQWDVEVQEIFPSDARVWAWWPGVEGLQ